MLQTALLATTKDLEEESIVQLRILKNIFMYLKYNKEIVNN